jgi:hypothetical protein
MLGDFTVPVTSLCKKRINLKTKVAKSHAWWLLNFQKSGLNHTERIPEECINARVSLHVMSVTQKVGNND